MTVSNFNSLHVLPARLSSQRSFGGLDYPHQSSADDPDVIKTFNIANEILLYLNQ